MTPETRDADERRREVRGFRIDLLIAICALLVSSLATGAAWWQSRVVAQQLSAQVWPYLSLQSTYDAKSISLTISNEGLGPARVRYVVATVDKVPQHLLTGALRTLMPGQQPHPHGSFTDLDPGSVIRVGGSVTLFRIYDPAIMRALVRNYDRIGLDVCYCAIIPGNCWTVHKQGRGIGSAEPVPVAECPDRTRESLQSGVAP